MKKWFIMLPAVCAALFAFAACGGNTLDPLNAMLDLDYSQIVLTVKNTFAEDLPSTDFDEEMSLTSVYEITYAGDAANVHYVVERFAKIDGMVVDESLAVPETYEGEALFEKGVLVSKTDDGVSIPDNISGIGFDFQDKYFKNVQLEDMYFIADVSDPGAFMGSRINCTDMKVKAIFLDSFYNIIISYTSNEGTAVDITYDFTL